jgi:hypothetical protein
MADFPLLTLEDECSWSWYLSCVKTNMLARPIVADDNESDVQRFYHAKYYGKAYMEIDRITSTNYVNKNTIDDLFDRPTRHRAVN